MPRHLIVSSFGNREPWLRQMRRSTCRSLTLLLMVVTTAFAQEPSRLRYVAPNGWTPGIDGRSLLPPGGNAVVTFAPSTVFAGSAAQWATQSWNQIAREMKVVSGPATGTQGSVHTQVGLFQQSDGSILYICLGTLVKDGHGESLVYLARDEARFRADMPALGTMLQRITVATPTTSTPASAPAIAAPPPRTPGPSAPGGQEVAGLHLATTRQIRFNALGGSGGGDWEVRTEFYLLSRDGRVFRGRDLPAVPGGDIDRFDYDAARRSAPGNYGTYAVRGGDVVFQFPDETITATRPEPDVLDIRGTKFRRGNRAGNTSALVDAPSTPPVTAAASVVQRPIDAAPVPTLLYQMPAGFQGGAGQGTHVAQDLVSGKVEIYDFQRFSGNFERDFRASLLRDWLALDSREMRVIGAPQIQATTLTGADQVLTAVFREEFRGAPSSPGGNWDAPRLRLRVALLAGGAVALVDINLRDDEAWKRHQAGLTPFMDSFRILAAPPPPTRAERLAVAGLWRTTEKRTRAAGDNDPRTPYRVGIEYYILSDDGRVHCQAVAPGGEIQRFDFAAAGQQFAHNGGIYQKRGQQLTFRLAEGPHETLFAELKGPDQMEILGVRYNRVARWETGSSATLGRP